MVIVSYAWTVMTVVWVTAVRMARMNSKLVCEDNLRNVLERIASKYKRVAVKFVLIRHICFYDTLKEKHFNVMLGSFRCCWSDAYLLVAVSAADLRIPCVFPEKWDLVTVSDPQTFLVSAVHHSYAFLLSLSPSLMKRLSSPPGEHWRPSTQMSTRRSDLQIR